MSITWSASHLRLTPFPTDCLFLLYALLGRPPTYGLLLSRFFASSCDVTYLVGLLRLLSQDYQRVSSLCLWRSARSGNLESEAENRNQIEWGREQDLSQDPGQLHHHQEPDSEPRWHLSQTEHWLGLTDHQLNRRAHHQQPKDCEALCYCREPCE